MKMIRLYTREPEDSAIYDAKLAYSMHIAVMENEEVKPLNHNSGVFFAKAAENPDGSLTAKSLKEPRGMELEEGSYLIVAKRTEADGRIGCRYFSTLCRWRNARGRKGCCDASFAGSLLDCKREEQRKIYAEKIQTRQRARVET